MIITILLAAYPEEFVWSNNWAQSLVDESNSKTIFNQNISLPKSFKELAGCQKYCARNQECMGCSRIYDEANTWNAIDSIDRNEIGKVNFEDKILSMKPG